MPRPNESHRITDLLTTADWQRLAAEKHFTEEQLPTLRLICEGLSRDAIARRLSWSRSKARRHVEAVFRAFGVHDRADVIQAVIWWYLENRTAPPT